MNPSDGGKNKVSSKMVINKKDKKGIRILRPLYVPVSNAIRCTFGTGGYVFAICKFLRRLSNPYFRNYINNYSTLKILDIIYIYGVLFYFKKDIENLIRIPIM